MHSPNIKIPLMSKKMMKMLLTLLFTCPAFFFFGFSKFGLSVHGSCFLPQSRCQGLCDTSSEIFRKFDAVALTDPSQNHIRPNTQLQIKAVKISTSAQLREILYTDWQDVLVVSSSIASRYYYCCRDGSTRPGN
jgi:hypothetical protein